MAFFTMFKKSATEMKSLKNLAAISLLIAVAVVLKMFVSIQLTQTLKISTAFVAGASIGMLFGPVPALLAGVVADVLGVLVKGDAYMFGFTIPEAVGYLLYGMILYKMKPEKLEFKGVKEFFGSIRANLPTVLRIVGAKAAVNLVCNIIINPIVLYCYGFLAKDAIRGAIETRIIKNICALPFECLLLIIVLPLIYYAYSIQNKKKYA